MRKPILLQLLSLSLATVALPVAASERAPNIVLILADDLGFSDIQSYGSEINTPALDTLAQQGMRFSNYHTAASCAPTRAMLLTGVDSHRNGVPNIPEAMPGSQRSAPNYQGVLSKGVVTVATLLRDAGYHTYMSGKWHLGKSPDLLPSQRGFDRTVALADTGADNWEQRPYLPMYKAANWYADGEPHTLPEDFYSSRYLVDKAIEFIDSNRDDGKPFFSYLAFQAVHIPVQAPREFTERYLDRYEKGWTELRAERARRARELGLVPPDADFLTMPTTADWNALSEAERRHYAKRMAVYAGMIEAMDHHIGRLIDHLKAIGEYDNTVFVFTSDNGPEASDPVGQIGWPLQLWLWGTGYNRDYDTLGERSSFTVIGPGFASAAASPLAYYKFYAGEGGMRVPLIIAGPGISKGLSPALTYVTDITPTLLALSGARTPAPTFEPITGKNLRPLLQGTREDVRTENDVIGYELGGNAALFKGDYKIVLNRSPVGDDTWRLFNIRRDPGETRDLATAERERLQSMLADYNAYVRDNNVLPVPDGYDQRRQVTLNSIRARSPELTLGAGALLLGIGGTIAVWQRRRKRV
ncbi:MAG: arylsulfatase [Spongiibacteraceae bacterium]|nr:arylsulfatase [Spongiibacteraceae bacterium]